MATKQDEVNTTSGDERISTVGVPEKLSFDERTAVTQPFMREDGTQDNGARDLDKVDGAKGKKEDKVRNPIK